MNGKLKLLNKYKFFILQKRMSDFRKPGEGGSVAYLLNTKYGEPVLVFHDEDREGIILNYYLETVHYGRIDRSEMILHLKKDSLFISDIRVLEDKKKPLIIKFGKGFGSIFMEFVIKEAEQRGYKRITGDMSFNDEKMKKRQLSYYKNYGFSISEDYKLIKIINDRCV